MVDQAGMGESENELEKTWGFLELTHTLGTLHRRVLDHDAAHPGEPDEHGVTAGMRQVLPELMAVFSGAFLDDPRPEKVFNYIMYLINQVYLAQVLETEAIQEIACARQALDRTADLLGMQYVPETGQGTP